MLWNVIVTERYTGRKCEHTEKSIARIDCRRGKIEIFDHTSKMVLKIDDCLLEGVGGENRMIVSGDIPFGVYKINNIEPFYLSTKENKKLYGPNPRLVFEPIKGMGDEANKSGRSNFRMHGGRQWHYKNKELKRTEGCIRILDRDAKAFYDWWIRFNTLNPNILPRDFDY